LRSHTHPARSLEDVSAIRSHGRRVTRQRALIWDVLVNAGDEHLSARQVADAVHLSAPDLHQATIYRALDLFVEDGLVRRTELDRRALYEVAAEHRHHHVVCSTCGAVVHVHDSALRDTLARVEAETGYALSGAELTFVGTCPGCTEPG
jgi:Fur family transcriptional regulator, ferric uptake regulator